MDIKNNKKLGYFRFKKLDDKYLLTNEEGKFVLLDKFSFNDFINDKIDKKSEIYKELEENNFIKEELNLTKAINDYASKRSFLKTGPSLHVVVVTLRCDHKCIYCHASAQNSESKKLDMNIKTADKVLDIIFSTTSPFVAIEFQGGEPLLNWEAIQHITKKAKIRAEKLKKDLELRLVTNLNQLDEASYKFLIDNKISICTSLDGPKKLHKKNRPNLAGVDNYDNIFNWSKKFNKDYSDIKEKGYIWKMSTICVVSKYSLDYPREIIDEYIKFGFENIFFRPLNPFGNSKNIWDNIKYSAEEFLNFYKTALDYIIKKNIEGIDFQERLAKIFLQKILTSSDPNMMELRSPCGAGIGQLAYNYNGDVYSCDEGRMMSMMGDESFRLGNVFDNRYRELVTSPVVRTLCTASCLEALPSCSECAYLPYCGTCPIYNYATEGNIFSQISRNDRCKINKGILDYLFKKLQDEKSGKVLKSWV